MDPEILKEAYDALTDDKKSFYVEKDGKYILDVAALAKEVAGIFGLKKNYEKQYEELKTAKAKAKEYEDAKAAAQKAAEEKEFEAKKAAGDFESIKKSYEDKIKAAEQAGTDKIAALEARINKLVVEADVFAIAKELAVQGAEPLLMDRVRKHVRAKYTDDDVVPEYLNEKGQPTAYSREEFMKIIASDPSCARIIKGSDATGGGHQGAAAASTNAAAQGATDKKGGGTPEEQAQRWQAKIDELQKK
jgi:hypothetical protein